MARASVDLPQPLSPTRPRLSPAWMVKLTPSTARSVSGGRNRWRGDAVLADHALDLEQRRAGEPGDARRAVRRGGEERAGVGMPHRAQHLRGSAPASTTRPSCMIASRSAKAGDHREVVGDQHQPHAVLVDQPAQQREDRRLGGDVEGGGRLVGDQELRAQRDRHGDADALALAAGELVRVARRRESARGQADAREGGGGDRPRLGAAGGAVDADGLGHLVADGLQRVQRGHRLLEDHADVAAADRAHRAPRRAAAGRAVERRRGRRPGAPCGRRPHDRERGHRLARAALADEAEDLAAARRSRATRSSTGWPWMASVRSSIARRDGSGHARTRRRRGSSRSRRPSPIRLRPSTVSTIARPGASASQGAKAIIVWLSASIRPQEGVGGWAPRPT